MLENNCEKKLNVVPLGQTVRRKEWGRKDFVVLMNAGKFSSKI